MKNFVGRSLSLCVVLALGPSGLVAASEPKVEMTVQLPPFIIEQPAGPKWRYLEIPRFEILSRCNDLATEQLALAIHRANQLLGLVLPGRLQVALDVPQVLIFYDERLWPAAEQAAVLAMLRQRTAPGLGGTGPVPPPRVRLEPVSGGGSGRNARTPDDPFFHNLMLADADTIATFFLVPESPIDPYASYLTPAYVRNLLESRVPALPAWFISGFMGLYRGLESRGTAVTARLGRWEEISPGAEPVALGAFFAAGEAGGADNPGRWLAQCELLVGWGLDPGARHRDGFIRLVERACVEPINESVFRECLGLDFTEAMQQLRGQAAAARTLRWELPAAADRLPRSRLEDASSRQVARLKGEWERLEARYVRRHQPDLETHYVDLARRTLGRAYGRGDRDPRLLASLGLLEAEAGDKQAAVAYLEQAVEAGVVRPRAYYELARQRYDRLAGRSTRNDGKFPAEQVEPIVQPLLAGMKQSPPLAPAYELLAHVSTLSVEPPPPEVLDALAEGARLFPAKRERLHELATEVKPEI